MSSRKCTESTSFPCLKSEGRHCSPFMLCLLKIGGARVCNSRRRIHVAMAERCPDNFCSPLPERRRRHRNAVSPAAFGFAFASPMGTPRSSGSECDGASFGSPNGWSAPVSCFGGNLRTLKSRRHLGSHRWKPHTKAELRPVGMRMRKEGLVFKGLSLSILITFDCNRSVFA